MEARQKASGNIKVLQPQAQIKKVCACRREIAEDYEEVVTIWIDKSLHITLYTRNAIRRYQDDTREIRPGF